MAEHFGRGGGGGAGGNLEYYCEALSCCCRFPIDRDPRNILALIYGCTDRNPKAFGSLAMY